MFNWDETYAVLISYGLDEAVATHYTSVLCKWDSLNYCPDIEVRGYLSRLFHFLRTPHERRWNRLSYDACYFLWRAFSQVWDYRKSLPRHRRV